MKEPMENTLSSLQPLHAIPAILDVMQRFPLVALGDCHQLQEIHDVINALLFHPEFVGKITDIVVEFGNARYQELVDRFLLECQAVDNTELRQVWRTAIGGRTYWDAPAYEQFFTQCTCHQLDAATIAASSCLAGRSTS